MAQPIGTTAYAPLPAVTTDPSGAFRLTVKPTKRTTYKAGFPGIAPEPTAVVLVKHSITLRAVRRSGKLYLRGPSGRATPAASLSSRSGAEPAGSRSQGSDVAALDVPARPQGLTHPLAVPRPDRRGSRASGERQPSGTRLAAAVLPVTAVLTAVVVLFVVVLPVVHRNRFFLPFLGLRLLVFLRLLGFLRLLALSVVLAAVLVDDGRLRPPAAVVRAAAELVGEEA